MSSIRKNNPIDKAFSKDRTFGTGAINASIMEEAVLFKKQVLYLIDKYFSGTSEYGVYTYLYKGNGAEFDKAQ